MFSKIDPRSRYHHVKIQEEYMNKTRIKEVGVKRNV
jgi:hypothetical protein